MYHACQTAVHLGVHECNTCTSNWVEGLIFELRLPYVSVILEDCLIIFKCIV